MSSSPDSKTGYERAACALLTLASDGTIERANETAAEWAGMPLRDLLGRKFQDLLSVGSKLFHQTHWLPLMELQGSVAEVQLELVVGEQRIPVLVNGRRRDDRRTDVALFIAADRRKYERELLLARRQAEEHLETIRLREDEFRTLAENSPDVIARFDNTQRCTYVSPAVERLLGCSGADFIDARCSPILTQTFASGVAEAFVKEEVTRSFEHKGVFLETRFVPEKAATGEVVSVLAITRDVSGATQRALLAEQLIGIVSHDLRNPLNVIVLAASILDSAKLGAHERTVQRIKNAANRATRLTADLLDFTQARLGGGLRMERADSDPHQVVSDCVDELRAAWPKRPIEHVRAGAGTASLDSDRIVQLITNLVNNAVAYGDATQPIEVRSEVSLSSLTIEVHNKGSAIPSSLQPELFEPMRRGTQPGLRSVGLGLYIVKEIAEAHGGKVTLTSTEAVGTTFRVEIPREP